VNRERELVTENCRTCKKPVYADEGYYSVTGEHYDCHKRGLGEFEKSVARIDLLFGTKRQTARRGEGASVAKLKVMIVAALSTKFGTDDVRDVEIYLTSPTWCRDTYDVHRFEGSAIVDGNKRSFGSWATVSQCLKYRELRLDDDLIMDLSPVIETKRGRKVAA
jgi:hypothetical protein